MNENIFDRIARTLDLLIRGKVRQKMQKKFQKYNINLTSKGDLIIQNDFGQEVEKEELQSDFNYAVRHEEFKILKNVLKKLGYPIEEKYER